MEHDKRIQSWEQFAAGKVELSASSVQSASVAGKYQGTAVRRVRVLTTITKEALTMVVAEVLTTIGR